MNSATKQTQNSNTFGPTPPSMVRCGTKQCYGH